MSDTQRITALEDRVAELERKLSLIEDRSNLLDSDSEYFDELIHQAHLIYIAEEE